MTIRRATPGEVATFFGELDVPVDMLAIDHGAGAVGVGGFAMLDGRTIVVSSLRAEAKRRPREVLQAAHLVMSRAAKIAPVFAQPNPNEPTARQFLRHLGFRPLNGQEDLYVFRG